jgi:hypothetical protein
MRPGFLGALVVHLYGELLWYVTSTVEKKKDKSEVNTLPPSYGFRPR